jgi:hypothetical protein
VGGAPLNHSTCPGPAPDAAAWNGPNTGASAAASEMAQLTNNRNSKNLIFMVVNAAKVLG